MGPRGQVIELRRHLRHRVAPEQAHPRGLDVAEVAALEGEPGHGLVDGLKALVGHVALPHAAAGGQKRRQELRPGEDFRVALAQIGQHPVDVAAEHRVRRDEEHLRGIQRPAVLVEQVGDALHEHRGLPRARHAGHLQHRHVAVAHHEVLLSLDGGRDGLHVGRTPPGERGQQQLVLNGHVGVEVADQARALDVELAPQLQVGVNSAPIGLVTHRAHDLVVVHLGHGTAPIHHEPAVVLVRHARRPDVELLGRLALAELQGDLREVGLAQQHFHDPQALGLHRVRHVVGLDDVVHGHDVGIGLQNVVPGGEVHGQLVGHILLVLGGCGGHDLHGGHRVAADLLQLAVHLGQMRLLGGEDGVGAQVGGGGGHLQYAVLLRFGFLLIQQSRPRFGARPCACGAVRRECPRSGRSCAARPGRRCPRASSCGG